ncbi:hypothetical protein TcBrA4_0113850 [Trypanosoma cruzi]|nr:hypothetical protein TcBrA4_0113850 [Trypanosoma cruzi]
MGVVNMQRGVYLSATTCILWSPSLARRFVATVRPVATLGKRAGRPASVSYVRGKKNQPIIIAKHSSKAAASGPTMSRSRFYRVLQERGVGFAMYLYIFGESMTLAVLYALHNDAFSTGDVFDWLKFLSADSLIDLERWSQVGPVVGGLRLSPRLLCNYLVANALTYPLYAMQFAFCAATLPLLCRVMSPVSYFLHACRARGKKGRIVPKAPSVGIKTEGRLTR